MHMQNFGTGLKLIGALLPIAYCGWMVWYFTDMGGLDNPLISQELKPTIIGLGIIGLLFVVGFVFKLRGAFRRPGSGENGGDPSSKIASRSDEPDSPPDADAMIARYLARRDAEGPAPAAVARPAAASFGRRRI